MNNKHLLATSAALAFLTTGLFANTAPTVVIKSATMRPGTGLMDIVFRVNDPDDSTVKTRALAFKDGVRSFANVIRPTTFAEGTGSKLGDAISTNTDHTITWDVASDWDVQLGQVKFEVLAMDGRGLLPLEWITAPAVDEKAEITISKNAPTDAELINTLFWNYAGLNSDLNLDGERLIGAYASGVFNGVELANKNTISFYAAPYIFKHMNLETADLNEIINLDFALRGELNKTRWHASSRPYKNFQTIKGWWVYNYNSSFDWGQSEVPPGVWKVKMLAACSGHTLALLNDGSVVGWGRNDKGQATIPNNLNGIISIAVGLTHSLALKNDGTVAAWGDNAFAGQTSIPNNLKDVTAVSAGAAFNLALKSDGTVVAWGSNSSGESMVPNGLNDVTAISAGNSHSLALKSDGTVVAWGNNYWGQTIIPSELSSVTAIAAGTGHNLALKSDGTVVGWGQNSNGEISIPAGLNNVTAIAAGASYSMALKSDGTVVCWGGSKSVPNGLSGVISIAAGYNHSFAIQSQGE
jgi:hypothetical protein